MINKIIDGISGAIFSEFGDGYEIYTDSVEQGLKEPCFFINVLNPSNEQYLGKRYFRSNPFMIQYLPSDNEKTSENSAVMERLFSCLELINVDGDLTRGTSMTGEMVDGVLNFRVNYDMFMQQKETEDNPMDNFDVSTDVEG